MPRRRPDVFDQAALEVSLRGQGCPASFISPVISDYRLFVRLVLRQLGEQGVYNIAEDSRDELGLGPQHAAWQLAAKYIVGWAREEIERYKGAGGK